MAIEAILAQLKHNGERITTLRRTLLELFGSARTPLSYEEITEQLRRKKITVNKTTVYRELEFLNERGIITTLHFEDESSKRYEWTQRAHHHHIRCVQCNRITDVVLEDELQHVLQRVKQQTRYTVNEHSMEFIGVCARCRKR